MTVDQMIDALVEMCNFGAKNYNLRVVLDEKREVFKDGTGEFRFPEQIIEFNPEDIYVVYDEMTKTVNIHKRG